MDEERRPCCFDEWASSNAKRARKKETVAAVTGSLLAALERAGLAGRSVLDVGCGAGDLALAAVAHGATRAHGTDLGPGAVAEARELARTRGLTDRVNFEIADGSTASLPVSDVVVLNRVVCCYPRVDALISNTLGAAGTVYAVSAPTDAGLAGALNAFVTWWSNRWFRLRRRKFGDFRVFIHDLGAIDARVRAKGFTQIHRERRHWVWDIAVWAR
jgi:SAM-dependent methyltransferase